MILGISGKKQSGKTTSGNFIASVFMANLGLCQKIRLNDSGQLVISDLMGNDSYEGVFDLSQAEALTSKTDYIVQQALNKLNPYVRLYSFADPLKQNICMDLLGLTYDQCYGTDEQKNTLTSIKWKDIPGIISDSDDYMTAREVMEIIGTGIFRKIKSDVWVEATINKIKRDKPELAIILDCRFPNEIEAISAINGKTIRLTRDPYNSNSAPEKALDSDNYDWSKFNFIIDNKDMNIYDQCLEIQKVLQQITI